MTKFLQQCPFCGGVSEIELTQEQAERYTREYEFGDKNIQDVLPELTAEEREIMQTGICRECQHRIFA